MLALNPDSDRYGTSRPSARRGLARLAHVTSCVGLLICVMALLTPLLPTSELARRSETGNDITLVPPPLESTAAVTGPSASEVALALRIDSIEAWWRREDYDANDWSQVIETARLVQRLPQSSVVRSLRLFRHSLNMDPPRHDRDSKPFILFRVVFDVQRAQKRHWPSFVGWRDLDNGTPHSGRSAAWPVGCRNDGFYLTADYMGSLGPPYNAEGEYVYMLQELPYRVLY